MSCIEFFAALDAECEAKGTASVRGERVRANEHSTLLGWEHETASKYSPGPISRAETLRKAIYERDLLGGVISRLAFSSLEKLGLSVDRCSYAAVDESMERARIKASKDQQRALGYLEILASDLRNQKLESADEARQAVGLYDTAQNDNSAHAEAFLILKQSGKVPLKSIQADLMDKYRETLREWPFGT